jgi:hypothetical protein
MRSLDGEIWKRLDRATIDPHNQLGADGFESVAYMACLAAARGSPRPRFVELGSTFFASKTKFEIIERIATERFPDWPKLDPAWTGVDNSRFMHDSTRALHGEAGIELFDGHDAIRRESDFAVFLSRFVASYVFAGGRQLADYLAERFDAALVEDAYSITGEDVPVFNHGQPEVFFALPETFGRLEQAGFEIYVLDSYPDFPAGSAPCHVIRCLAAKKARYTVEARSRLEALGFATASPVDAGKLLPKLNAAVSAKQWRAVERAKRTSPVWGRAARVPRASWRARLAHWGWGRYRLGGPAALAEIYRALDEEKP